LGPQPLAGKSRQCPKARSPRPRYREFGPRAVTEMTDIEQLVAVDNPPLYGAITGRAIYEGTLDLAEAIRATKA
ncbi:MAG: hypothetical protein JKY01_08180, partial [Pseudomonadales bacterium]|nr:hypothetical protein [Pseudomonadales bacterium]